MEPMDEFFKKKLEGRDLPFNEAHWASAQQMLEDREAERGVLWWWRTGLLAILLAALIFALVPYQVEAPTTAENGAIKGSKPNEETVEAATPKANGHSTKAMPHQKPSAEKRETGRTADAAPVPPTIKTVAPASGQSVPGTIKARHTAVTDQAKKTVELEEVSEPAQNPMDRPIAQTPKVAEARSLIAAMNLIPKLSFRAERGEEIKAPGLPEYVWQERNRWSIRTVFGGSLPVQEFRAGTVLGLGANWPGKTGWGLYAEGLYRIRQFSSLPTQSSQQRSYGFGVSESTYALRANSLHFIDINLGATYTVKRHEWHAGAGFSYLLGARGQLDQAQKPEEELSFGPTIAISEGWVSKAGLSDLSFRAQAGYAFELYPNLFLSGRIQYGITSVFEGAAITDNPPPSPLLFDLMIKYELW